MPAGGRNRCRAPNPLNITFGIEVEFLVPACKPQEGTHQHDGRWYIQTENRATRSSGKNLRQYAESKVVSELRQQIGNHLAMSDDEFDQAPDRTAQARREGQSGPGVGDEDTVWRVGPDKSVQPEDFLLQTLPHFSWAGVEIASAVMRVTTVPDDGWADPDFEWDETVGGIWARLRNNLRVRTATSCGLHVHVGLDGIPIPENTIKRFVTFIWLLEDALRLLYGPWRASSAYCKPITQASRLAWNPMVLDLDPKRLALAEQELSKILPSDRLRELVGHRRMLFLQGIWLRIIPNLGADLLDATTGLRSGVSIEGCYVGDGKDNEESVKHTIELRYPNSTLEAAEIELSVRVFVRLFQMAHCFDQEDNASRVHAMLERVLHSRSKVVSEMEGSRRGAGVSQLLEGLGLASYYPVWEQARRRWQGEKDQNMVVEKPFVDPETWGAQVVVNCFE